MPNNFPDWSGTWTNVKGFAGKTPWFTENWSALVDRTEDIAQVIDTATAGYTTLNDRHLAHEVTTTEVEAARDGYASLLLKQQAQDTDIATRISNVTGLISNLSGNSYRGVSFTDGIDPQDLTTVAQVNAIVVGGGSPSTIPITSLNVGTATANQKIKVDPVGTAIIGVDDVTTVTGLEVGTATADQLIRVNPTGTAIIGEDQSNLGVTDFGVGNATANSIITTDSGGTFITSKEAVYGGLSGSASWNYLSTGTFRLDQSINTPMPLNNCTVPSYPLTVSITSFADNGSGGTTCTAVSHGLAENDTLQFSFNGISIHRIFNITTNTFDIGTAYTTSPTSSTANIYTVLRTTGSGLYLINFSAYISHTNNSSGYKQIQFLLYANGESLPFSYQHITGGDLGDLEAYTTISRTHYIKSDYENNSFGCRLVTYIEGTSSSIRLYLTEANFQVLRV